MKDAIKLTLIMWEFLAEDGTREKDDHPDFHVDYEDLHDHCPLCEVTEGNCIGCPLAKPANCYHSASHFVRWLEGNKDTREKYAMKIVKRLKKALKKIKKKESN